MSPLARPKPDEWRQLDGVIGRNLRRLRMEAGFTQGTLADIQPVSRETINRIEGGLRPARPVEIVSLGMALGVPPTRLFIGEPGEEVLGLSLSSPAWLAWLRAGVTTRDKIVSAPGGWYS